MPGATGGNLQPLGERKRIFGQPQQPQPPPPPPPQLINVDALDARLAAEFDIQTLTAAVAAAEQTIGSSAIATPSAVALSQASEENKDSSRHKSSEKKRHKDKDREHRRDRSKDRKRRRSRSGDRKRSRSPRRRSRRSRSKSKDRRGDDDKPRRSRFDLTSKEESGPVEGPEGPQPAAPPVSTVGVYNPTAPQGLQPAKPKAGGFVGAVATSFGFGSPPTSFKFLEVPKTENSNASGGAEGKRKRKSRWGEPMEKAFVPGLPTMIPSNLSEDQQRAYLLQLKIEEISGKLRSGEYGINPDPAKRSPSPEPVYDNHGKRLNTREVRTKQKLEKDRHETIQEMMKINPLFKPPADYKQPVIKLHEKVWIPQDDHPEVNFVGLLLGPRGNTLKSLERETGARIIIRGKGSVKEGKFSKFQGPMPGEDEPLHAYITSTDEEVITIAVDKIRTILEQAVEIPDGQNELRKLQLRELALLNGTLRPEDLIAGGRCTNCGANTHKTWECPDAPNVTANVICTSCGAAGHISRDCKNPKPGAGYGHFGLKQDDIAGGLDEEYSALMAELGQDGGGMGDRPAAVRLGSVKKGPFGRFMSQSRDDDGSYSQMPEKRRPQPIVRINLAKPKNTPGLLPPPVSAPMGVQKPPSLLSLDVSGPDSDGGGQGGGRGGPGGMMPPWGPWPPMPPGMMMPPMPGMDLGGDGEGAHPPWLPPPPSGGMMSPLMGMVPPPPPSSDSSESGKSQGQQGGAPPMGMMMPPWMGMGMPPMMPFNMAAPPPPPSDKGPAPVPPPPPTNQGGGLDFSSMLAPPPPPPPPPEG